jgi:pimeloyl-ACP methyl ester carboxylesterase
VWYRAVGGEADAVPLLCLHGGPGFTHYYLEALESLADRRRVIFYDQLGCGRSDRPGDLTLWTVDRFVAELAQVRSALNLDRLHLFGSSWGGMLAMQYVLDGQRDQPALESLILCGSPASMIRWVSDCDELLAEETPRPGASSASTRRPASPPVPGTRPPSSASTASTCAASTRGRPAWSAPSPKRAWRVPQRPLPALAARDPGLLRHAFSAPFPPPRVLKLISETNN